MPYYNKCWKTEFQPMKMENANLKYVKATFALEYTYRKHFMYSFEKRQGKNSRFGTRVIY